MPGLVLKLRPGERVMINGVVMENGDRRARLNVLTPDAKVLRLRDAIHPAEADTPLRRVCYIAQLALAGEADQDEARTQILAGIAPLAHAFTDPDSRERLAAAREATEQNRLYPALKSLRSLLNLEARLLQRAGA